LSLKVRSPWKHGWQSCVGPLPSQEWAWRCSLFRSPSWKTDAKQCAGGWSKRSVLHLTVIRKSAPCARQRKRYRLSFVLRYSSFVISCPCAWSLQQRKRAKMPVCPTDKMSVLLRLPRRRKQSQGGVGFAHFRNLFIENCLELGIWVLGFPANLCPVTPDP